MIQADRKKRQIRRGFLSAFFVPATSRSPGLPGIAAAAYNTGMYPLILPVIYKNPEHKILAV